MAGPLGRIVAQVVIAGVGVVSRAFVQAYQQAVHNAQTGKTTTQAASAVVKKKNQMPRDQALAILNFDSADKPVIGDIKKQFDRYFEANDPAKGGSFYLQSKVFRAKEALEKELEEQEKAAADATSEASEKKESS